jgi:class 3 adenylate cyclase
LKRTSLRRTILIYTSGLLVVLIVAMLAFVNFLSNSFVNDRIEKELRDGSGRVTAAEAEEINGLRTSAAAVAAFPALQAMLSGTDVKTIRDALPDFLPKETADLLVVLDPQKRMIARTDSPTTEPIPGLENGSGIVRIGEDWYHFASAPSDSSGKTEAIVVVAEKLDDGFAKTLSGIAGSDIVIVTDHVVGSTLSAQRLPFKNREEWDANVSKDRVDANGQEYVVRSMSLAEGTGVRPLVVLLQSYDAAIQPFRVIQYGLLALGIAAALAGFAASAVLARKLTAPVGKLIEGTQQVATGNFEYRIETDSSNELGTLADSFNTMIVGLRERADMQKFVSQSTVDMIQAAASKKVSAGERVTLTILFSDMRGFTSMSENRPPEEVVRILNECLSLQAARVKKFGGDIDKFVGDCVVALFTGDDMEYHAIRCAVEMHKAIQERNTSKPDEYQIQVGIGIATGEVILGSIGSDDRLDYTVIGSHVNLCSRICSLAGPRETLMAQSTYERVEGVIAAERLEPVQVKGFKEPVPLYRMAVGKS